MHGLGSTSYSSHCLNPSGLSITIQGRIGDTTDNMISCNPYQQPWSYLPQKEQCPIPALNTQNKKYKKNKKQNWSLHGQLLHRTPNPPPQKQQQQQQPISQNYTNNTATVQLRGKDENLVEDESARLVDDKEVKDDSCHG